MHARSEFAWLVVALAMIGCGDDGSTAGDAGVSDSGTGFDARAGDASVPADAFGDGGTTDPWLQALETASMALEGGATEVAFSPDGAIVYRRTVVGDAIVAEEIAIGGIVVATWTHAGDVSTERWDVDADGRAERAITTTRGAPPDHMTEVLEDPDDDGMVDRRITFERMGDTVRVVTEEADDGGVFRIIADEMTTPWQAVTVTVNRDGDGTNPCSEAQANTLRSSLLQAMIDGLNCLDDAGKAALARQLMRGVELKCQDLSGVDPTMCAVNYTAFEESGASPGTGPVVIIVDPDQFFVGRCGSNTTRTLFHEMMHSARGGHSVPDDPVRACEALCYGTATQKECVACLGLDDCARCGALAHTTSWVCSCTGDSHPSSGACFADCPTGLSCFVASCDADAPPCP